MDKSPKKLWKEQADSFLVWPLVAIAIVLVVYAIYLIVGGTCVPSGIKVKTICDEPPPVFSADGTGPLNIVGWILSGIIATLAAIFLNRRARAMDNQANAQFKSIDAQVKNNEQARFNQGIQHLGHDSESVRLGGVHTLYQLAEDKDTKDKYCKTVHDILCAHLRSRTASEEYRDKYREKPSEEIQSLLDLLTKDGSSVFRKYKLKADFHSVFLCGADLREAHLEGAHLTCAHLEGVSFDEAHLEGAFFDDVHLEGAILEEAHLEGVFFNGTYLEGADLQNAHLEGADLSGAYLDGAHLSKAHLEGASVYGAHLRGACLDKACLHGVCSTRTNAAMDSFRDSITSRIGKDTELDDAIFKGGVKEEQIKRCENAKWYDPKKKEAVMDILKDNRGEEKRGKDIEDLKDRYLSEVETGELEEDKADEIIRRCNQIMRDIEDA